MLNEKAPERIWAIEQTSPFRVSCSILEHEPDESTEYIRADLAALSSDAVAGGEELAWLRDLDGTGSLHPAAKGDPGAFPVYSAPPEIDQLRDRVKELENALGNLLEVTPEKEYCGSRCQIETTDASEKMYEDAIEAARRVREGGKD